MKCVTVLKELARDLHLVQEKPFQPLEHYCFQPPCHVLQGLSSVTFSSDFPTNNMHELLFFCFVLYSTPFRSPRFDKANNNRCVQILSSSSYDLLQFPFPTSFLLVAGFSIWYDRNTPHQDEA